MTDFTFTKVTSEEALTKKFELEDDEIVKTSSAQITSGTVSTVTVNGLNGFKKEIQRADSNQAFMYGVMANGNDTAQLVTQTKLHRARGKSDTPESIVARTRKDFNFAPQPGILMLDHDEYSDGPLDRDDLLEKFNDACPGISDVSKLWKPSSSFGVQAIDDESNKVASSGQRLYMAVNNAADIPDIGDCINTRLWAKGIGWIRASKSGQMLVRSLFDACVWQPERLDFVGPVILGEGLERNAPAPIVLRGKINLLTLAMVAVDDGIRQQAQKNICIARDNATPQIQEVREAWIKEHASNMANNSGISVEQASVVLRQASTHLRLSGDFLLRSQEGKIVRVAEILDNPAKWNGMKFSDPLEPNRADGDRRVATAHLGSGGRPYIWSFAHGGVRYTLERPCARIKIAVGDKGRMTPDTEKVIAGLGEVFDYGDGGTVKVVNGQIRPVSSEWLAGYIDSNVSYYKNVAQKGGSFIDEPADAPNYLPQRILSRFRDRGFPLLQGLVTAPTLRLDGSILDTPGYDPISQLLYISDVPNPPKVPTSPTIEDAKKALKVLWHPFRKFPFVERTSATVMVSAIISAILRASLPTCPAHAFDAPAAGTGKTLLAECIGIIATGKRPAIMTPTDDDTEIRKRLFAILREGGGVIIWDNISGPLGGDAFDSFLTAESYRDRVLGLSETETMPNRSLLLVTGNNISTRGDTFRRVLTCRLDAKVETPYLRTFPLNPREYCMENRMEMVVAALTIVRAWITDGKQSYGKGQTASFEDWDRLVRQPLVFLANAQKNQKTFNQSPKLVDVVEVFKAASAEAPHKNRLSAVLLAWEKEYGTETRVSAAMIYELGEYSGTGVNQLFLAVLEALGKPRNGLTSTHIGNWLSKLRGVVMAGLHLERDEKINGSAAYRLTGKSIPE